MKKPANILMVHNFYRQAGGEDAVFRMERDLLTKHGHQVATLEADNRDTEGLPAPKVFGDSIWSREQARSLTELIRSFRPEIVHFHNTFFRISPAAIWAARSEGVPVVQTLHNFRLACVNGLLFRDGRPCETCVGKPFAWPGIRHKCYHDSHVHSASVAVASTLHAALGTYRNKVNAYIALSRFSREKFIRHGLPAEKIHVKGNFIDPDPGPGDHGGEYALFVGRLSPEKGLPILLKAWETGLIDLPLKIAGSGPLEELLRSSNPSCVEFSGQLDRTQILQLMKNATVLIFPSQVYENFPVTIVEAFATGLPVIASDLGAMAEIVGTEFGYLFRADDPRSLADTVRAALASRKELEAKGMKARERFVGSLSAECNYRDLIGIYRAAAET